MKLLILTQKIDISDDVLGFMHGWIAEFAKHCDKVTAVCLEKGEYDLPKNVRVLSLGKEIKKIPNSTRPNASGGREFQIPKIRYVLNFYRHIWTERSNYDKVFVHMNDEYVVLGGILWRALGKKISLWYAHGYTPFSLIIAEKLAHVIFTSTRSGCRMDSKKIKVVGQGIDVDRIKTADGRRQTAGNDSVFRIITIGRISPSKDYETLIRAVEILAKGGLRFKVDIIGGSGTPAQGEYFENLKEVVKEKNLNNMICFKGPLPNRDIAAVLNQADLFVNMGQTGSLDKAILEAMAAGLPVLTCNEALEEVLGGYKENLMYKKKDFTELSEKIKAVIGLGSEERMKIGDDLREIVVKNHSLSGLIKKIVQTLDKDNVEYFLENKQVRI
jgi:glycosyltransferase involved in cell wall biosynthesis